LQFVSKRIGTIHLVPNLDARAPGFGSAPVLKFIESLQAEIVALSNSSLASSDSLLSFDGHQCDEAPERL